MQQNILPPYSLLRATIGHPSVSESTLSQSPEERLTSALSSENIGQLRSALESGIAVDGFYMLNGQHTTPLAFAVQEKKVRSARFLMENGATAGIAVTDIQGRRTTPLKMAEEINLTTGDNRLLRILSSSYKPGRKFDANAYKSSVERKDTQANNADIFSSSLVPSVASNIGEDSSVAPSGDRFEPSFSVVEESTPRNSAMQVTQPSSFAALHTVEEELQGDPADIALECLRTRKSLERYVDSCPDLLDEDIAEYIALGLKDKVTDSKDPVKSQKKVAVRLALQEEQSKQPKVKTFWNQVSVKAFEKPIAELFVDKHKEGFAAIAGMDDLKKRLYEKIIFPIQYNRNPQKYTADGKMAVKIGMPNGLILAGLQGTGKTYIAHKLAEDLKYNYMEVSLPDVQSKFIGDGGKLLTNLFKKAEENKPCILLIDEFDSFVPNRGEMSAEQAHLKGQVNQLLLELEKAAEKGILVIGTTNHLKDMDPAITRPGRFDNQIIVPPPYLKTRMELFRMYLRKMCKGADLFSKDELKGFAERTKGYSSKDIEMLCEDTATIFATLPNDKRVNAAHVHAAISARASSLRPEQLEMYYVEPYNLD